MTLYASKTATDQLIAIHKLTVEIVERRLDREAGIYEVHCRVRFPDGHHVEDFAALSVAGLKGEALCNALMKAVTKAKRRTVLSACGLGMLDESEIDSIPGAVRVNSENLPVTIERPHGHRALVHEAANEPTEERVSPFKQFVRDEIARANDELRNVLLIDGKGAEFRPVCNEWQLANGLVSNWIEKGLMEAADVLKADGKRDRAKVGAALQVAHSQDPEETEVEVRDYVRSKLREAATALGVRLVGDPDDAPDEAHAAADEDPAGDE